MATGRDWSMEYWVRFPCRRCQQAGQVGSLLFGVTDTKSKASALGKGSVDTHWLQADLSGLVDPVSALTPSDMGAHPDLPEARSPDSGSHLPRSRELPLRVAIETLFGAWGRCLSLCPTATTNMSSRLTVKDRATWLFHWSRISKDSQSS